MSTMVTFKARHLQEVRILLHRKDLRPCADDKQFLVELGCGEGVVITGILCQHGEEAIIKTCDLVIPDIVE